MRSQILIVDDEPVARQSLSDILKLEGHSVTAAPTGQVAVEYVRTHTVDLAVVDLRMPGMDGLEVAKVINQVSPETQIILLTAYGSTETAIQGLRLRIHDYVLKPASPQEIVASVRKGLARRGERLRAQMERSEGRESLDSVQAIQLKDGTLVDLARRQIHQKNKSAHLTPAEGRLLRVLMENPGKVFSHRELVLLVQGYDTTHREAPEVLRPLISRLRHKLESFPGLSERIASIRGTGYVYEGEK